MKKRNCRNFAKLSTFVNQHQQMCCTLVDAHLNIVEWAKGSVSGDLVTEVLGIYLNIDTNMSNILKYGDTQKWSQDADCV